MSDRNCIFCRHFVFEPATPGYSALTPGDDLEIFCGLYHWELKAMEDTQETFMRKMLRAAGCDSYSRINLEDLLKINQGK